MVKQSKHILLLGTTWPFRPGGIATFNERLARALASAGHRVTIFTFSLQYPKLFFPGRNQYSDQPAPPDLNIRIKVNSINPFNWLKVGKEIRRMAPDLLIIRFWIPYLAPALGTIARLARKNGRTRVITIADNIIPHEHRPGDRQLISFFVHCADGFITLSRKVTDDLKKFREKVPVRYTPHPLYDNFGEPIARDTALGNLGLDPSGRYVLFFGFIRDYKGLDLLLLAFAKESVRKLGIKLVVAGEYYTSPEKYDDLIRNYNLERTVILHTDFIPDKQVPSYFCGADLVVQPYKTATQSGVTQIAYHFGKPMVVTNVGGLGEMVPHGKVGYCVPPEPGAIAEAISDFFTRERATEFMDNIREEKKRFGWDRMVDTIESLDEEILKNRLI